MRVPTAGRVGSGLATNDERPARPLVTRLAAPVTVRTELMTDRLLSPSTITAWLDCSWYLTVKLGETRRYGTIRVPFADLLMQKGLDHENACLAEFEAQGLTVFRTPDLEAGETFAQWVARVGNPMADGWDVIYQFPMVHDGLRGIADFLVQTPESRRWLRPL